MFRAFDWKMLDLIFICCIETRQKHGNEKNYLYRCDKWNCSQRYIEWENERKQFAADSQRAPNTYCITNDVNKSKLIFGIPWLTVNQTKKLFLIRFKVKLDAHKKINRRNERDKVRESKREREKWQRAYTQVVSLYYISLQ